MTAADINGDGRLDVLAGSTQGAQYYLNQPAGDGTVAWAPVAVDTPSDDVRSVAVADIDGDGRADLLVAGDAGVRYYLQEEPLAFTVHTLTTSASRGVAAADVTDHEPLDIFYSVGRTVRMHNWPRPYCPSGYQDGGDFTCVPDGECVSGYHDGGEGVCVLAEQCTEGYAQDEAGACTQCAVGYHGGGDGRCVPEGTCSDGYGDGGDGACVPNGTCSLGYHDNGEGTCVPQDQCAPGYENGGDGSCVLEGTCASGYHNGGTGWCVPEGTCTETYALDDEGACTVCDFGLHNGGAGHHDPSLLVCVSDDGFFVCVSDAAFFYRGHVSFF